MGVENWQRGNRDDDGNKRKQPGLVLFSQNATLLLEAKTHVSTDPSCLQPPSQRLYSLFIHMIHTVFMSELTSVSCSQKVRGKNSLYTW